MLGCIWLGIAALAGCGGTGKAEETALSQYEIAETGTWKDGVYTETAEGKKGEFPVSVTIEDGKIAEILIGENQETPDKGGVAIEELPGRIVEAQSPEVDAVSGATVTSEGVKDAVARCLEQASQE